MKHILFIIALLLTAMTANAQHEAMEILPGQDGELPVTNVSKTPTTPDGTFSGLWMSSLYYHHHSAFVVNGNWMNEDAYEADLYFPNPNCELLQGDYYTLQYYTKGAWHTVVDDNGNPKQLSLGTTQVIKQDMQFRLELHGGPKDGWHSNTLVVNYPAVNYSVMTRGGWSEPNFIDVGVEQSGCFVDMERQNLGVYDPDRDRNHIIYTTYETFSSSSSNYRRQWYRQNPYTFERTAIEGATTDRYVPTVDDLGMELVDVVRGDDSAISFYYEHNHGRVQIPILCYPDYMGNDGFVLNTNYKLPNGGKDLIAIDWSSSESQYFPQDKIVERKPGQYVFATPCSDESGYMMAYEDEYGNSDYHMALAMKMEDGSLWYHLATVFFSEKMPINAKPSVAVPVDVICQNTSGDWVVAGTIEPGAEESLSLSLGRYYMKTRQTASTLATYYPSTLLWGEAETVKPGVSYDADWNELPNTYAINVVAQPAPLAGQGTIEGTVSMAQSARMNRASGGSYTVYLKQKDGGIVAITETDAGGAYRFTQVPYGSYVVLVNIDGCIQEQATEVVLTAEKSTVSGVNYTVEGTVIKSTGSTGIISIISPDTESSIFSLDGRKGMSKGLNIIRMSNGKTMKVMK